MGVVTEARDMAGRRLAGVLPDRWSHVRVVATKAVQVGDRLNDADRQALVAAAWLHDVGFAPDLTETGFHPLDGAQWLRRQGFDPRVTAVVAHHSCAAFEATERGLADELATEFPTSCRRSRTPCCTAT